MLLSLEHVGGWPFEAGVLVLLTFDVVSENPVIVQTLLIYYTNHLKCFRTPTYSVLFTSEICLIALK